MVRVVELVEGKEEASSVGNRPRVAEAPESCVGASEPPAAVQTARNNSGTRELRNSSCGKHVDKGSHKPYARRKASTEAGAHCGETTAITCVTTSCS